jgi:nicotinamidase-related amidase
VVDACAAAVSKARAAGVPVVWVVREHHASGHDVERTRAHLFDGAAGKGVCIHGSEGARLHEELEPLVDAEADIWLVKTRFSAFFNTNLDSLLRRLGTRTVAICGVQTPNCIRGTAWDALALDYNVVVLSDATASRNAAAQAANLEDMTCAGIHCPTWEGWAPE